MHFRHPTRHFYAKDKITLRVYGIITAQTTTNTSLPEDPKRKRLRMDSKVGGILDGMEEDDGELATPDEGLSDIRIMTVRRSQILNFVLYS